MRVCNCTGLAAVAWMICTPPLYAVDTGQDRCYGARGEISCPQTGERFHGQDGNYSGLQPSYRDNGDGTVSDQVTGLMWSKEVDLRKVSLQEAMRMARKMRLGGHRDWRVPTIKELYSLIDFRGNTGSMNPSSMRKIPHDAIPYINTDYFDFAYGDVRSGERFIDAQWLSRTEYVHTTMDGIPTLFGVNFADGRIKGYGYRRPHGGEKKFPDYP